MRLQTSKAGECHACAISRRLKQRKSQPTSPQNQKLRGVASRGFEFAGQLRALAVQ